MPQPVPIMYGTMGGGYSHDRKYISGAKILRKYCLQFNVIEYFQNHCKHDSKMSSRLHPALPWPCQKQATKLSRIKLDNLTLNTVRLPSKFSSWGNCDMCHIAIHCCFTFPTAVPTSSIHFRFIFSYK